MWLYDHLAALWLFSDEQLGLTTTDYQLLQQGANGVHDNQEIVCLLFGQIRKIVLSGRIYLTSLSFSCFGDVRKVLILYFILPLLMYCRIHVTHQGKSKVGFARHAFFKNRLLSQQLYIWLSRGKTLSHMVQNIQKHKDIRCARVSRKFCAPSDFAVLLMRFACALNWRYQNDRHATRKRKTKSFFTQKQPVWICNRNNLVTEECNEA